MDTVIFRSRGGRRRLATVAGQGAGLGHAAAGWEHTRPVQPVQAMSAAAAGERVLGSALLLLLALLPASALLFQSQKVSSQWDTWAVCANNTYHAFMLSNVTPPTALTGSNGAVHASCSDGVHFDSGDHGMAWRLPEFPQLCAEQGWSCSEGTSSVFVHPGATAAARGGRKKFSINYSLCRNRGPVLIQNISFAESDDLQHWSQVGGDADPLLFNPDGRYYRDSAPPNLRWDTITGFVPVPGDEARTYGYWTASPLGKSQAFGMGVTSDGIHWGALPPPEVNWTTAEAFPGQPNGDVELGGVALIKYRGSNTSKYFLLGGSGWSMWTWVADQPTGPFRAAAINYRMLEGAAYFARFFEGCCGTLLVSHQAFGFPNHFLAPYKRADVDEGGVLRLKWWQGNDALAGAPLSVAGFGRDTHDLGRGVFVNGTFDLKHVATVVNATGAGVAAACLPGFTFELTDGSNLTLLVDGAGRGYSGFAAGEASNLTLTTTGVVDRALALTGLSHWKLLVRASIVELYIDDVFLLIESVIWRTHGAASMTGRMAEAACGSEHVQIDSVSQMTLREWKQQSAGGTESGQLIE